MADTTLEIRPGEVTVEAPPAEGPALVFIGQCRTPWKTTRECPRRGDLEGPLCQVFVNDLWAQALRGIEENGYLQILYWMHHARRDLVLQNPKHKGQVIGTFAIRSPNRPNPIASSVVKLEKVEGNILHVRGLDCLDGTPVVDIKPDKCPHA
ncbi:MAG: tRNA (N6-threonylcarbamoyladenosine(37)-N6)-methyltransferase TrmO [Hyphomicrobiales bacterium]|nr:tRNA (N6-threonylcarbamoyladenosine(37)-N6)-methyltransferase TrmO [Hyphomicrobiales bacterium]